MPEKQKTLTMDELKLPKIRTSNQELEEFNAIKIRDVFMKEAILTQEKAEYYTKKIMLDLQRLYLDGKLEEISTRMLRELMCANAITEGDFETRHRLAVVGMPVHDVHNLFFSFNSDNSNQIPCEDFFHKVMADKMNEEYSLLKIYNFNTQYGNPAYHHLNADIYIHDRDYPCRPFCYQHSARFIFRSGLFIDGNGKYVNTSRPPNSLDVAIKQVCEFLGACSRNWNGGQSFRNLFWELGPFIEKAAKESSGMKELNGIKIPEKIAQAAQMLRYEPNHVLVGRGSQAAFSSISNFVVPPKYLTEDSDVILPKGKVIKGNYEDYRKYVLQFWYAYLHESIKGDANGSMFHWMKDDIGIKPKWFNDPELYTYIYEPAMKYISKFGGPYIYNVKNVSDEEVACTSCCSLVLESDDPNDYEYARQGTLGMGALQCGSINLPRIAYLANGDDAKVYELIDNRLGLIKQMMLAKHKFMKKFIDSGVAPFLTQPKIKGKDSTPYFELNKQSLLISFVGLNEFTKAHMGQALHESEAARKYGMKIVLYLIKKAAELKQETGLPFGIWRQPAETVAGKLAQDDWKKFNGKAIVQGDPKNGSAYYSNFTHCAVNAPINVAEKVKYESPFHGLSSSNLLHVWLGESTPDTDSLWNLTKKIIDNSPTSYFAYTKDITVCNKCRTTHGGIVTKCSCGAGPKELVVQSRITGYYSTVGTVDAIMKWKKKKHKAALKNGAFWQPSKFSEFQERTANYGGRRFAENYEKKR